MSIFTTIAVIACMLYVQKHRTSRKNSFIINFKARECFKMRHHGMLIRLSGFWAWMVIMDISWSVRAMWTKFRVRNIRPMCQLRKWKKGMMKSWRMGYFYVAMFRSKSVAAEESAKCLKETRKGMKMLRLTVYKECKRKNRIITVFESRRLSGWVAAPMLSEGNKGQRKVQLASKLRRNPLNRTSRTFLGTLL